MDVPHFYKNIKIMPMDVPHFYKKKETKYALYVPHFLQKNH